MKIIFYILIIYLIYGLFLVWLDFHSNIANRPNYTFKKPNIKTILCAVLVRPTHAPYFFFVYRLKRIKQKPINKEVNIDENDSLYTFCKKNIKNWKLLEHISNLPISGENIGEIVIDNKNKTIKIEIRQCEKPQLIGYYVGHLVCKNAGYEILQTDINGAVFKLDYDQDNKTVFNLQINNNRQGIIIKCSDIELMDYKQIKIPMDQYGDIYTGMLWGKYFKIIE